MQYVHLLPGVTTHLFLYSFLSFQSFDHDIDLAFCDVFFKF